MPRSMTTIAAVLAISTQAVAHGHLTGTVYREDGKPCPQAVVRIYNNGTGAIEDTAITGEGGVYIINVKHFPQGPIRTFWIQAEWGGMLSEMQLITVEDGHTTTMDLWVG